MKNIRNIIREEIDDFDWIRDISPMEYGNFNEGDKFMVVHNEGHANGNVVFTIDSVTDNDKVIIKWYSSVGSERNVNYYVWQVNNNIDDGIWVIQPNTIKEQDDLDWIRDIQADPIRPHLEEGYDTVVIDIQTSEEYDKIQQALFKLGFHWREADNKSKWLRDVPTLLFIRGDDPQLTRSPYNDIQDLGSLNDDEILIDNPFI